MPDVNGEFKNEGPESGAGAENPAVIAQREREMAEATEKVARAESWKLSDGLPRHVAETKQMRKDLDAIIQRIKGSPRRSAERMLALRKIQEGVMWLGMDLKDMNEPNPYPDSYNPASPKIEPMADGLKL